MVYVQRDAKGKVLGIFQNPQPQADGSCLTDAKPLADDDPEVIGFLTPTPQTVIKAQLADIDAKTGSVRWVRELALGVNAAWDKQRELQPDLPLPGTGMAKVQAIEDQAAALRKQLAALPA